MQNSKKNTLEQQLKREVKNLISMWPNKYSPNIIIEWSDAYDACTVDKKAFAQSRTNIIELLKSIDKKTYIVHESASKTPTSNVDIEIKSSSYASLNIIEDVLYEIFKDVISINNFNESNSGKATERNATIFEIKSLTSRDNSDIIYKPIIIGIAKKMLNLNYYVGTYGITKPDGKIYKSSLKNIKQRYYALVYFDNDCTGINTFRTNSVSSERSLYDDYYLESPSRTSVCRRTASISISPSKFSHSSTSSSPQILSPMKRLASIDVPTITFYDNLKTNMVRFDNAKDYDEKINIISEIKINEEDAYHTQGSYLRWVELDKNLPMHLLIDSCLEQLCFAYKIVDKDIIDLTPQEKRSLCKYLSRAVNTFTEKNTQTSMSSLQNILNEIIKKVESEKETHVSIKSYLNVKSDDFAVADTFAQNIQLGTIRNEILIAIKNILSATITEDYTFNDNDQENNENKELRDKINKIYEKITHLQGGGYVKQYHVYKGHRYLVRSGPRGGKYILVKGENIYLEKIKQTQKNKSKN